MFEQENKKSMRLDMPGFGKFIFYPNSGIEERAIELIHLSLKLKSLEREKQKIENSIGQKWEELRNEVLAAEIPLTEIIIPNAKA